MKLRNLFLSAALVALAGFGAYGCNENPSDPDAGSGPTGLQVSSLSETSVALKWNAVTGATNYRVAWAPVGTTTAASGEKSAGSSTEAQATNLTAGVRYRFSVTATTPDGETDATTIEWAGAGRHTNDVGNPSWSIRMYEKASAFGSGLRIDPSTGGPVNVSLAVGRTGIAQLAMYLRPETGGGTPTEVIVGPILAIPEYKVSGAIDLTRIDTTVYISAESWTVQSLSSWYLAKPLNELIAADGNIRAFTLTGTQAQSSTGFGFVVRHGASGNYHYARVVVLGGSGGILKGTSPNRYVDMEISYQDTPNLPFAKPVGAKYNAPYLPSVILN